MIDYNAAYDELYAIGAENAEVLALLGHGPKESAFLNNQLIDTTGRVLPWLVWSYGEPADNGRGSMADMNADWWAYTTQTDRPRTLYAIAHALDLAYANVFSVAWGRVGIGKPRKPFFDKALGNIQGVRIPLTYRTLG